MRTALRLKIVLAITLSAAAMAWSADAPAAKPAAETAAKPTGPDRWEPTMQKFEAADKASPPPQGAVLFAGSSTFTMWKTVAEDLKPLAVINRGFGGSTIPDVLRYVDRIVIPCKPRHIVFYAGDNDLKSNRKAEQVLADFQAFVAKVRAALPETKILFVSIKPSPSRAMLWDEAQKANRMIREFTEKTPGLAYIDTATAMLGADGKPKPEIFLTDNLHMNRQGYEIWIPIVKAALEKAGAKPPEKK